MDINWRSTPDEKALNNKPKQFRLANHLKLPLVIIQIVNLIPLMAELTTWFLALTSLCIIFHLAVHLSLIKQASRLTKILIALLGCVLLIVTGRELGLLLGMLHLLCFAYLLKPLEVRQQSDFYQLIILGLLLLACSFIFQQSIYFTLPVLLLMIANFALLSAYIGFQQRWQLHFIYAVKLLLLSMPLAVVLFFVFPKIAPFWQMPIANTAKTGLSDTVKVGDIAKLALSNELAFRVEFSDQVPSYDAMYWRTLVLTEFDGRQWLRKKRNFNQQPKLDRKRLEQLVTSAKGIDYQVIAEPSYQQWLFGLDIAVVHENSASLSIAQLSDYSLLSRRKINQPVSYQVTSYLSQPLLLDELNIDQFSSINLTDNPRLADFGQALKQRFNGNARAIINQVLQHYRQENYRYTLTPPRLNNNSLDQFFFETQAGFCEHYASSFTYLMRAAGIPSRIVLGYLGGEYNLQGNYYSVYQRDAHAWSEVWLPNSGWVRVDPTAAVDPNRVERGFSQQLMQEQRTLAADFSLQNFLGGAWLSKITMQLDAIDYQWTKLVINFSQQKQQQLLFDWLGDNINLKAVVISAATFAIVALLILLAQFVWRNKRKKQPETLQYYRTVHQLLAKFGIPRPNEISDDGYIQQLNKVNESIADHYQVFIQSYNQLHYQPLSQLQRQHLLTVMKEQRVVLHSLVHGKGL